MQAGKCRDLTRIYRFLFLSCLSCPSLLNCFGLWNLWVISNIQHGISNRRRKGSIQQVNPIQSEAGASQSKDYCAIVVKFKFCEISYSIDACIFTLDIGYSVLDIGYSPAGRDTALRDGILNIQIYWVFQGICASGYWD